MVYDSRWQETSSCAACCCGKITDLQPSMGGRGGIGNSSGGKTIELEARNSDNNKRTDTAGSSSQTMSRQTSKSRGGIKHAQSMIEPEASSYIMEKLGSLLLDSTIAKIITILVFIGYLVGATIGILDLHAYQDPVDLAPKDSYLVPIYDAFETYFDVIGPTVQWNIDKSLDYSDPEVYDEIQRMIQDIRNDECFMNSSDYTSSWINDYNDYLEANYPSDIVDINQSTFYDTLYNEYLLSSSGEQYIPDIWSTVGSQVVGITTVDGLQVDLNETEIFGEDIIGAAAYQSIQRSRIYLNFIPVGTGTSGTKDCIENLHRLQDSYEDSLGMINYSYFYGLCLVIQ